MNSVKLTTTFYLKQITFLQISKVLVSINLQFTAGCLIGHDDSMWMELKSTDGPHLTNPLFYTMLNSRALL